MVEAFSRARRSFSITGRSKTPSASNQPFRRRLPSHGSSMSRCRLQQNWAPVPARQHRSSPVRRTMQQPGTPVPANLGAHPSKNGRPFQLFALLIIVACGSLQQSMLAGSSSSPCSGFGSPWASVCTEVSSKKI